MRLRRAAGHAQLGDGRNASRRDSPRARAPSLKYIVSDGRRRRFGVKTLLMVSMVGIAAAALVSSCQSSVAPEPEPAARQVDVSGGVPFDQFLSALAVARCSYASRCYSLATYVANDCVDTAIASGTFTYQTAPRTAPTPIAVGRALSTTCERSTSWWGRWRRARRPTTLRARVNASPPCWPNPASSGRSARASPPARASSVASGTRAQGTPAPLVVARPTPACRARRWSTSRRRSRPARRPMSAPAGRVRSGRIA